MGGARGVVTMKGGADCGDDDGDACTTSRRFVGAKSESSSANAASVEAFKIVASSSQQIRRRVVAFPLRMIVLFVVAVWRKGVRASLLR